MEQRERDSVPYIVHESAMARNEREKKRLVWIIVLLIIALVGTNLAWTIYESQFVDEEVTQEVDTGDGDAFVAGIGDVYYGEGTADNETADP